MADRSKDRFNQAMRDLEQVKDSLVTGKRERANELDNSYISTRYPNAHPDGAPYEHCGFL